MQGKPIRWASALQTDWTPARERYVNDPSSPSEQRGGLAEQCDVPFLGEGHV